MNDATPATAATPAVHSVSLTLSITGNHNDVVRDVGAFLEFIEGMRSNTSMKLSPTSAGDITEEKDEWPKFGNRFLEFRGQGTTFGARAAQLVERLWQARGEIVPQGDLLEIFAEASDSKQEVHTNVHRLRAKLEAEVPHVRIETAGTGYRMKIVD